MSVLFHCLNNWKMNWTILKDFQIQKSQVVYIRQKKSALVLYQWQWFFFFRRWQFLSWHSLLVVNKTMRKKCRRVQKMQQKKKKKCIPNGESGAGNGRIWQTDMQKGSFSMDEKTQFRDFSQNVAYNIIYFTLFFTFSRKLPISQLVSQCEIGDSLGYTCPLLAISCQYWRIKKAQFASSKETQWKLVKAWRIHERLCQRGVVHSEEDNKENTFPY